jgi:hypothetical protein
MMKRSLLLAVLFSSWAGSQTLEYVLDLTASVSSQTSRVKVDARQNPTSSGVTCSYHVTNGATKPIYMFQVGAASTGMKGLPVPPLHWNQPGPGATPPGWFETLGSGPGGHSMGWQAKTSKDLIQPGESRDFRFEFALTEGFECNAANSTVKFAAVFPEVTSSPTTLSITLSNLQIASERQLEGDVSIQNLGPNDTMLNLGMTLGNGSRSYPDRLSLVAHGSDGSVYNLPFIGPGAIVGRVDPMVVPLPKRSVYTVHGQWWPREVTPNTYAFHIEFEGVPPRDVNLDMPGMNLFRCWLGKVSSNEITLSVPEAVTKR